MAGAKQKINNWQGASIGIGAVIGINVVSIVAKNYIKEVSVFTYGIIGGIGALIGAGIGLLLYKIVIKTRDKKKSYRTLNIIQTVLLFAGIFLGFKNVQPMLLISGYTFIVLGILTFGSYLYFKRAPVLWVNEQKGLMALIWTIFEGTAVIAVGIYILINL
ncbi:MAG: hypothetical protein AABX33_02190 [Nanoarchaeota archaeon]